MMTSFRSKSTIDLVICTKDHSSMQCQPVAYNVSDHFPTMVDFNDTPIPAQNDTIPKVNWEIYTTIPTILSSEIYINGQFD